MLLCVTRITPEDLFIDYRFNKRKSEQGGVLVRRHSLALSDSFDGPREGALDANIILTW